MEEEFKECFIKKYSKSEFKEIDRMIEKVLEGNNIGYLNGEKWSLCQEVEKINVLQYTHFISLCKEINNSDDEEITIEFENGINNGTVMRNYCMDGSCGSISKKTIRVLKDVEIDWEKTNKNVPKKLVECVFCNFKEKIMDIYRKQNYDNYVTGGGTNLTDSYYKEEKEKIQNRGIFWKLIFEEIEVDRTFV